MDRRAPRRAPSGALARAAGVALRALASPRSPASGVPSPSRWRAAAWRLPAEAVERLREVGQSVGATLFQVLAAAGRCCSAATPAARTSSSPRPPTSASARSSRRGRLLPDAAGAARRPGCGAPVHRADRAGPKRASRRPRQSRPVRAGGPRSRAPDGLQREPRLPDDARPGAEVGLARSVVVHPSDGERDRRTPWASPSSTSSSSWTSGPRAISRAG